MSDSLPLIVANHKANLDYSDFDIWINSVGPKVSEFQGTVILCPSAPFLSEAWLLAVSQGWKYELGAQDISKFDVGAYTGEVAALQLSGTCSYVIIGHSERRNNFGETDEILEQKVQLAKKANLKTIFCVQDQDTKIPEGVEIVAYEPIFAIGTGNPDTPDNAMDIAKKIKAKGDYTVLYGGSVNRENVKHFIKTGVIDGVLIGTASLNAQEFIDILHSIY